MTTYADVARLSDDLTPELAERWVESRNVSLPEAHRIWTLAAGNADDAQIIWLHDDSWTDANSAGQ